jgi:ubiquinone/menaquinone biosynthesis C-methylase UbiE
MATPWDRADAGYLAEWLPRFTPYHLDLVEEMKVETAQRVLVACCGTGAEVLGVARELAPGGRVRATDADPEMVRLARARVDEVGFANVAIDVAPAEDASGGPYDAVLCAFALWQLDHRVDVLGAWRDALAPHGKVGILTWGPAEESDAFELMTRCLKEREPAAAIVPPRMLSARDSMSAMFEQAGLVQVRHTIVRHTLAFSTAESFVVALRHARSWHAVWDALGEERMGHVVADFYNRVGGPTAPLPWDPPATLAVAARPGDEIGLRSRPSVKVPAH